MSEIEKISKSEYLAKKEEVEMEFKDTSRATRCILVGYSFLGLPRFYQGDKKLGIVCILLTISLIFLFLGAFNGSEALLAAASILSIFMFLILPIIELVLALKDKKGKENELLKLSKVRELLSNYEIEESKSNEDELKLMTFESKNKKKSIRLTAILGMFLGFTGAHRFYLGDQSGGFKMLIPFIIQLVLSLMAAEYIALAIISNVIYLYLMVVFIMDVFKLEDKVFEVNKSYSEAKIEMLRNN